MESAWTKIWRICIGTKLIIYAEPNAYFNNSIHIGNLKNSSSNFKNNYNNKYSKLENTSNNNYSN